MVWRRLHFHHSTASQIDQRSILCWFDRSSLVGAILLSSLFGIVAIDVRLVQLHTRYNAAVNFQVALVELYPFVVQVGFFEN